MIEFRYWRAYYQEKHRLEQEAEKKSTKKSGKADQEFKRTMGSQ